MKRTLDQRLHGLRMALLNLGFLTAAATLQGAAITWGPATDISSDSDVLNAGTLVYAYAWSGIASAVNGVSFTGAAGINGGNDVSAPAFFDYGPAYFTSSAAPFSALSTVYSNILIGADYVALQPVPVTLENLTIGRKYAVQVWVNDPRGPENARSETITSEGGNTNILGFSINATTTNPGGSGQYTIGTFTADATNETFTLNGANGGVTQMNALQLRDVGTPAWSGIKLVAAGTVELTFRGPAGAPYTLLTTTNAGAPLSSWIPVPNGTGTFGAAVTINLDSTATNRAQFYRIRTP